MASGPVKAPDFGVPANDGVYTAQPQTGSPNVGRLYYGDGERPPPPPPSDPNAGLRRFKAKRLNEHVKSGYSAANTLALAIFGTAVVLPEIKGDPLKQPLDQSTWIGVAVALFLFGHGIIWWLYQRED